MYYSGGDGSDVLSAFLLWGIVFFEKNMLYLQGSYFFSNEELHCVVPEQAVRFVPVFLL